MGAGQSSSGGGEADVEVKISYYTLLDIERTATEEDIKKAYRRKALELHPDRNYGNEEAATKTFADIQAAHEVLSDPQERAWYDSHESAILRGDNPDDVAGGAPTYDNVKVTSSNDLAKIIGKFNKNVEFSDSPTGFFGFLRETFEHLAKEEDIAGKWENVDVFEWPTFGHRDDGYRDTVKQFYQAWTGFTTVKSFSWVDKWRLSEAPDRWVRRRMEQDNAKLRKDAKDEFNDAVRSLVQFMRKRDPRVVLDTRSEEERAKALRDAAATQRRRAQEENAAKIKQQEVPAWATSREPDPADELEGTFSESEKEEEVLECVACNKIFKSENQWQAHEKSKKHQKAIKDLQRRMRNQNAHLNLGDDGAVSSGITSSDVDEEDDEDDVLDEAEIEDQESQTIVDDDLQDSTAEDDEQAETGGQSDQPNGVESVKKDQPLDPGQDSAAQSEEDSEDEDYASRETVEARLAASTLGFPSSHLSDDEAQSTGPAPKKKGKAAQKRAKRAQQAQQTGSGTASGQDIEDGHKCSGCNEQFSSKTKLFDHLKSNPKHAALKAAVAGGGKGKKKGKK